MASTIEATSKVYKKEYIYTKNMWDEYLKYLEEKITKLYKEKES